MPEGPGCHFTNKTALTVGTVKLRFTAALNFVQCLSQSVNLFSTGEGPSDSNSTESARWLDNYNVVSLNPRCASLRLAADCPNFTKPSVVAPAGPALILDALNRYDSLILYMYSCLTLYICLDYL